MLKPGKRPRLRSSVSRGPPMLASSLCFDNSDPGNATTTSTSVMPSSLIAIGNISDICDQVSHPKQSGLRLYGDLSDRTLADKLALRPSNLYHTTLHAHTDYRADAFPMAHIRCTPLQAHMPQSCSKTSLMSCLAMATATPIHGSRAYLGADPSAPVVLIDPGLAMLLRESPRVRLPSNPMHWSPIDLASYLSGTDCREMWPWLAAEAVDGQAFMLLTLPILHRLVGLQWQDAVRLAKHVVSVKRAFVEQYANSETEASSPTIVTTAIASFTMPAVTTTTSSLTISSAAIATSAATVFTTATSSFPDSLSTGNFVRAGYFTSRSTGIMSHQIESNENGTNPNVGLLAATALISGQPTLPATPKSLEVAAVVTAASSRVFSCGD
ncbi:unnamed protein product [Protopolystoma xenopodis]|uniref:SAM domain-containing protein n=1 Tax=Protopolystoma xenopodis TaxID=117903 RepID=A0A3S5A872_9PLAT|nr:unnamed protein product [Protopolystoma xenopodis]